MEREVEGGIGMGNTCKPRAVLFQCMTKFTTNKTIKLLKKKKDTLEINKERYFRNKDTLRFMTDKKSQYRKLREFKAG